MPSTPESVSEIQAMLSGEGPWLGGELGKLPVGLLLKKPSTWRASSRTSRVTFVQLAGSVLETWMAQAWLPPEPHVKGTPAGIAPA